MAVQVTKININAIKPVVVASHHKGGLVGGSCTTRGRTKYVQRWSDLFTTGCVLVAIGVQTAYGEVVLILKTNYVLEQEKKNKKKMTSENLQFFDNKDGYGV